MKVSIELSPEYSEPYAIIYADKKMYACKMQMKQELAKEGSW